MAMATGTVFQASDLNQRGRLVLDAARAGEARIRDKDGMSLLVIPERRYQALLAVNRAAANLAALQCSMTTHRKLSVQDYGDWTWLRSLDEEDRDEFIRELCRAVIVAAHEESSAIIEETLNAWRITAQELDDPDRRAILLGDVHEEDFLEVSRPEETEAVIE